MTTDIIAQHEGFDDMLAIVRFAGVFRARSYANCIIKHLTVLYTREREYHKKQITNLRSWATSRLLQQGNNNQTQYARCKSVVASLVEHEQGLTDYLMYRASTTTIDRSRWIWTPHDEIPAPINPPNKHRVDKSPNFALSIPQVTSPAPSDRQIARI